ncbi:MAG: hypothetical protein MJK04_27265 [Psychrosphaera sp.]|nr:hypothetical protein [Psychrosphaera sp.]
MTDTTPKVSLKLALFGGAGIGALLGFMMGTSITPVVATFFGALTGILAGILGLNDGHFSNAKAVRVGGFGFACVLAALLGLFVRTHNLMSPSLQSLKQQYVELGFSETQALDFVAQKAFGVSVAAVNPNSSPKISTQIAQQHSSLLFSAAVDLSSCDELEGTDATLPLDEIINNFELTGQMWENAALLATEQLEPSRQKAVLLATKAAICASDEINDGACAQMMGLAPSQMQAGSQLDYRQLTQRFEDADEGWKQLALSVEQYNIDQPDKQQVLLMIIKTLCEV